MQFSGSRSGITMDTYLHVWMHAHACMHRLHYVALRHGTLRNVTLRCVNAFCRHMGLKPWESAAVLRDPTVVKPASSTVL